MKLKEWCKHIEIMNQYLTNEETYIYTIDSAWHFCIFHWKFCPECGIKKPKNKQYSGEKKYGK